MGGQALAVAENAAPDGQRADRYHRGGDGENVRVLRGTRQHEPGHRQQGDPASRGGRPRQDREQQPTAQRPGQPEQP